MSTSVHFVTQMELLWDISNSKNPYFWMQMEINDTFAARNLCS